MKSIKLLGDFNARTSNLDDILENNNKDYSEELKQLLGMTSIFV